MTVELLPPSPRESIRRALAFIATTSLLDDEFETRLGVRREELVEILMRWPRVDDRVDGAAVTIAINNALNEVVHGLDLTAKDWQELGATRSEVEAAYADWAKMRGWQSTGLR